MLYLYIILTNVITYAPLYTEIFRIFEALRLNKHRFIYELVYNKLIGTSTYINTFLIMLKSKDFQFLVSFTSSLEQS